MVYDIREKANQIDVIQFADDGFIHISGDVLFVSSSPTDYEEYENMRGVADDEVEVFYKAMKKAKGIISENNR